MRGEANGLPVWVVCQLDSMLSAGIVRHDQLHGLDADALCEVARAATRHALDSFDADAVAAALARRVAA